MWILTQSGILINSDYVREFGVEHNSFIDSFQVFAYGVGHAPPYLNEHRHLTYYLAEKTADMVMVELRRAMDEGKRFFAVSSVIKKIEDVMPCGEF